MRWDQHHQPQPEQFWKTPATGELYKNKAREQRIISALHDIIVLNNGEFLDYTQLKDKAIFPNTLNF